VRRAAARSQCANNLKQFGLGLHNYADTSTTGQALVGQSRRLPAGTIPNAALPPEQRLSWFVDVLPFVEQTNLYRQFNREKGWADPANEPAARTPLKIMHCPDWGRETTPNPPYLTAYLGVAGLSADAASLPANDRRAGVFGTDRRTSLDAIGDGMSNTLMILESAQDNGPWAQGGPATVRGLVPEEQPYLGTGRPFGGTHFSENSVFGRGKSVGCNAGFADGSLRFLSEGIAPSVLEALATTAGGEEVGAEW
jgi:hypothetical protein